MKLFKNKVGRPSNEIKNTRKIFIVSLIAILLSTISLLISSHLLNESLDKKLFAATRTAKDIKITINPVGKSLSGEEPTKVSDGLFSADYYIWKNNGDKYVDYTIENNSKSDVWYGWFIYKKSESKNNLSYGKKASERGCVKINKNSVATTNGNNNKISLSASGDNAVRIGKIKVYSSKEACEKDNDGTASSLNSISITYKYGKTAASTVESNDNKNSYAVSLINVLFKSFIEILKKIFMIGDKPGSGDPKPTTKGIVLTCPSEVKVNQEFYCTANLSGVTISFSKQPVDFQQSWTTTESDKAKPGKFSSPQTITVTATKNGYATKTAKVEIVSSSSSSTAKNFKTLSYNVDGIKKIGKQSTDTNCYDYAVKYGNYIAPGKSVGGDICTGSGWDRFKIIKNKIDAGVPVILQVKTGAGNQHWITVVGYNTKATEGAISTKSDILKHLYAIDPWNLNIGLADTLRDTPGYFTIPSDGSCKAWN